MSGNPKVSVIVPVYNVEDYVGDCLDCLINQTFADIEILCINDGSTDNSLAIVEEYAAKDDRIRIISQENQGLGAARNVGMVNAHGEYLNFVDSDDYISLNSLEMLYNNAISNDSDLVLFKMARFHGDEFNYNNPGFKLDELFEDVDFNNFSFTYKDVKSYVMKGMFSACVVLYRREFLEKYPDMRFPEHILFEDVLFHVMVMLRASRLSFCPEFFYYYRANPDSITHSSANRTDIYKVVSFVEDFLKKEGYFDEFEIDFNSFKISEFMRYILYAKSEEFFYTCKDELAGLEYDESLIEKKFLDRYHYLMECDTFIDFLIDYEAFVEYDYKSKNKELKRKNKKMKEKNKNLKEKNSNLKEKNKNLKEKNKNLKEKNSNLKERNKDLKVKLKKVRSDNQYHIKLLNEYKARKVVKIADKLHFK